MRFYITSGNVAGRINEIAAGQGVIHSLRLEIKACRMIIWTAHSVSYAGHYDHTFLLLYDVQGGGHSRSYTCHIAQGPGRQEDSGMTFLCSPFLRLLVAFVCGLVPYQALFFS